MIDGLYNTDVLFLAANISHVGRLENPDGTARKVSKLCGSWVEVDVCLGKDKDEGVVTDFAVRLQACALGQASAAILAESVIGANIDELRDARDSLRAMLKQGEDAPTGRFSKLFLLAEIANYPARHTSTMLAFDAIVEVVARIDVICLNKFN